MICLKFYAYLYISNNFIHRATIPKVAWDLNSHKIYTFLLFTFTVI